MVDTTVHPVYQILYWIAAELLLLSMDKNYLRAEFLRYSQNPFNLK